MKDLSNKFAGYAKVMALSEKVNRTVLDYQETS